jgi:hypothetical protein
VSTLTRIGSLTAGTAQSGQNPPANITIPVEWRVPGALIVACCGMWVPSSVETVEIEGWDILVQTKSALTSSPLDRYMYAMIMVRNWSGEESVSVPNPYITGSDGRVIVNITAWSGAPLGVSIVDSGGAPIPAVTTAGMIDFVGEGFHVAVDGVTSLTDITMTYIGTGVQMITTPVAYANRILAGYVDASVTGVNIQNTSFWDNRSAVQSYVVVDPITGPRPLPGYSIEITLASEVIQCHADWAEWYDYGQQHDQYTTIMRYAGEDGATFGTRESNTPLSLGGDGFLLFGPHILYPVDSYVYPEYQGRVNTQGTLQDFSAEVIPSGPVTIEANGWAPHEVTGFRFGTLNNCPVPLCEPVSGYPIQFNRMGDRVREYDRGLSTIARPVKFRWELLKNEACAAVLKYILQGVRTTTFSVDFGPELRYMSPWELREGEDGVGSVTVRINSPQIRITNRAGNRWDLEIEVRKWRESNGVFESME